MHLRLRICLNNCISIVLHVDCRPFDEVLGSGKRLVIRDQMA